MKILKNRIGMAFGHPELLPGAHNPTILHSVDISSACANHQPGQEIFLDFSKIDTQPYVAIITKSGKSAGIIIFMVSDLEGYVTSADTNSFQCTACHLGLKSDVWPVSSMNGGDQPPHHKYLPNDTDPSAR